jgi:hypothetical protein
MEFFLRKFNLRLGGFFGRKNSKVILAASAGAVVVSYFLFCHSTQFSSDGGAIGFFTSRGANRRHLPQSVGWELFNRGGSVYLNEMFYVSPGNEISLTFKNKRAFVGEPNSIFKISDYTESTVGVTVFSGEVKGSVSVSYRTGLRLNLSPHFSFRLIAFLPDLESLTFKLDELIERVAQYSLRNIRMEELRSIPKDLDFSGTIDDYVVRTGEPTPGSRLVGQTPVSFSWSKVPLTGILYRVEIALTQKNPLPTMTKLCNGNRLDLDLDRSGEYRWRVRAILGNQELVSETSTFQILGAAAERQTAAENQRDKTKGKPW